MAQLAVVIPNFNGKKILHNCLTSLSRQTFRDFKIYVVDNGSNDGSPKMVRRDFPAARLVLQKENTGFARPSNLGIRKALEENKELQYVCPLNNDVELKPDYLEELVQAAQKYQTRGECLGILAAKLLFKQQPQIINSTGTVIQIDGSGMERGFKEKDYLKYQKPASVFGSCAAAALYTVPMLRKIAFKNAAGESCYFDEDFFAYYEDLDLNYRSRLAGFSAFYVPRAVGYHLHSATAKSYSPFKSFYVHRNQYFVLIKNFPLPYLILGLFFLPFRYIMLIGSILTGKGPSAQLKKNLKNKGKTPKSGLLKIVFSSWRDIIKNLPALLKKRKAIQKKRQVGLKEFGSWFQKYRASFKKMIFN